MAELPLVVLDASVVIKWYLPGEEDTTKAIALQDAFRTGQIEITLPQMARYEVANAVNVARRHGRISADDARQAVADFLAWDFTYAETADLVLAAMDTAQRIDCALYDALYFALAESLGATFVTADRALFLKTRPRGSWVKWLGDYQPA